uniref:Uncharacterized protein n=1 Tax=viral metagenome TaxID=1070528 RepID=A0A6M3M1Y5_9ZZZZ
MEESTASFLDKTDWRITIHRKLEACVDAEGTEYYPKTVKSLISAVGATYPGWDAKEEIRIERAQVSKKYYYAWVNWLDDNPTAKKTKKYHIKKLLYHMEYKEIFEFIKNRCASKRMMLWGSKKIPGGTQIFYHDDE